MNQDFAAAFDQLFQSTNDVLFAKEFVEEVAALELPVANPAKGGKPVDTEQISDAAAAVIYRWTAQELQFFFGSAENIVGATARKIEIYGCWVLTVELAQLLHHAVSIVFFFDEQAQVIRVLAAMPAFWMQVGELYDAKKILAKDRLTAMVVTEMIDVKARENQFSKKLSEASI